MDSEDKAMLWGLALILSPMLLLIFMCGLGEILGG